MVQGLSKEKPDDEKAKRAAEAARLHAEECIMQATAAEARAKNPYEDVDEGGPKSCNAVFKAEGFGMLEAMTQVHTVDMNNTCTVRLTSYNTRQQMTIET